MNCTKCGAGPAPYCPSCRWLLKLTTVRPYNLESFGLPRNNDYDERNQNEPIPNHRRVQDWYECFSLDNPTWRRLKARLKEQYPECFAA